MKIYTEVEMNAAITRVETAKRKHPVGWDYLAEVGLQPPDDFVVYAFTNAKAHESRLKEEDDLLVIYSTGWLQGLSIGAALPR